MSTKLPSLATVHAPVPATRPVVRRILRPGTCRADARYTSEGSSAFPTDMKAPLAAQECLQFLLESRAEVGAFCTTPTGVEPLMWQFENIRQFVTDLNQLTTRLQLVCTSETCRTMNATDEWQYLCAAHRTPKECCAIDYMVHTLDGTSYTLGSEKSFPSRTEVPSESFSFFQSMMRRLYRIFSHAYFHHKEVFLEFEGKFQACQRFVAFSKAFSLVTDDQFIVPASAFTDAAAFVTNSTGTGT